VTGLEKAAWHASPWRTLARLLAGSGLVLVLDTKDIIVAPAEGTWMGYGHEAEEIRAKGWLCTLGRGDVMLGPTVVLRGGEYNPASLAIGLALGKKLWRKK